MFGPQIILVFLLVLVFVPVAFLQRQVVVNRLSEAGDKDVQLRRGVIDHVDAVLRTLVLCWTEILMDHVRSSIGCVAVQCKAWLIEDGVDSTRLSGTHWTAQSDTLSWRVVCAHVTVLSQMLADALELLVEVASRLATLKDGDEAIADTGRIFLALDTEWMIYCQSGQFGGRTIGLIGSVSCLMVGLVPRLCDAVSSARLLLVAAVAATGCETAEPAEPADIVEPAFSG